MPLAIYFETALPLAVKHRPNLLTVTPPRNQTPNHAIFDLDSRRFRSVRGFSGAHARKQGGQPTNRRRYKTSY
jgi:hypothetical protein